MYTSSSRKYLCYTLEELSRTIGSILQIVSWTSLLQHKDVSCRDRDRSERVKKKDAGVTKVRKYGVSQSNSHTPAVTLHFSS